MKHLELHILQSVPVTCLNRDDLGSPKTAFFGGVQRARVSSQSWKRAIREYAHEICPYFEGKRTRLIIEPLQTKLMTLSLNENEALIAAKKIAEVICKLDTEAEKKGILRVKTMHYTSNAEIDAIAEEYKELQVSGLKCLVEKCKHIESTDVKSLAKECSDTLSTKYSEVEIKPLADEYDDKKVKELDKKYSDKKIKVLAKKYSDSKYRDLPEEEKYIDLGSADTAVKKVGMAILKDAADISLFGRMVANDHSLTIEGAAMFNHPISTHKVDNELDFFAAVDDWQKEGESGAGMTGTLEFNSSVYYRFAALNLGMLADKEHLLSMTVDERKEVVSSFIQATLEAVPGMTESNSGRKNSMNGYTRPAYVLGIVRDKGHPVQLINAFEEPIWSGAGNGIMAASITELKKEEEQLNKTWKLDKHQVARVVLAKGEETDIDEFVAELVSHVE